MTLLNSLRRRAKQRRMYQDLLKLDDHLLRDIGFDRAALRQQLAARRRPLPDSEF